MDEIARQVIAILAEQAGMNAADISLETPLTALNDSPDMVETVMALEDRLDLTAIAEVNIEEIRTVGDLVEWLRRSRGEDGGAGARAPRPERPPTNDAKGAGVKHGD